MRKSANFLRNKSLVYHPIDFHVQLPIVLKKIGRLPPIPESVAVVGNRWKKLFGVGIRLYRAPCWLATFLVWFVNETTALQRPTPTHTLAGSGLESAPELTDSSTRIS